MKPAAVPKIDPFAQHKAEYAAKPAPALVQTSAAVYLAIEGADAPGGEAFSEAVGALYGIAFTVKMRRKSEGRQDYVIGKLEALWPQDAVPEDRKAWRWRLMIRTPDFVTAAEVNEAADLQIRRGKSPKVREVKVFPLDEGLCVQALHVGPYDRERETIEKMRALARTKGFGFTGAHHEIYLSDPRRVAPEKLRTILRHQVEKTG